MFYALVFHIISPLFKLFYRIEVRGIENLQSAGALFASNHKSYLDPVLVGYSVYPKRLHYMAKAELWKIPVLGRTISALNAFPVNRGGFDRKAVVKALELLREGRDMLMFPEGTRIRRDGLGEARPGIAAIAIKAGVRIVPVGITGADKVLPDGARIPRFPKIVVSIGEAMDPEEFEKDQDRLMEAVMNEIGRLTGLQPAEAAGEGAVV
ncbi:MAG: lysophospholipid acyltransferase family protein [Candidatus Aquicultorales bacterium]